MYPVVSDLTFGTWPADVTGITRVNAITVEAFGG